MKRIVLLSIFTLITGLCNGQEWFRSFDVAKRLAIVQNKMLFVLWEESFNVPIPLMITYESGQKGVVDLSVNNSLDPMIWDYYVPVRLSELNYEDFLMEAKGRGYKYINKLNDDSIKIMDVNGNILNIDGPSEALPNFSTLISQYALNTTYIKPELENYLIERNFHTSFRLAVKYIDFAILTNDPLRSEIIVLANIYLNESEEFLTGLNSENNDAYLQRIELTKIKELLILKQFRRANRKVKRIDEMDIDTINEPLFVFLKYTIAKLMDDEIEAELWKSKISSLDLRKAELILNINQIGIRN